MKIDRLSLWEIATLASRKTDVANVDDALSTAFGPPGDRVSGLGHDGGLDLPSDHVGTKPYTSGSNGKAVRFIQTSLREWTYLAPVKTPANGHRYNWQRPHASIDGKAPISTIGITEDNLSRLHT